jgi:phosphoglycerol transferase MdoB-like AlkP superfamily enzyme
MRLIILLFLLIILLCKIIFIIRFYLNFKNTVCELLILMLLITTFQDNVAARADLK